MAPSARSRRLRWVAPFATAAVIALLVAVPGLSAANTPSLPVLTPAQLLAKVQQANVDHLSGTLDYSANLGIPNLSALADAAGGGRRGQAAFSPTDLLSGSRQVKIWIGGPDQVRLALLQDMAETEVVHDGTDTWLWDSTTKKVTHFTRAPGTASGESKPAAHDNAEPTGTVKTPQQLADELLAHLTPSTTVTVSDSVTVAGHDAYQLVLAPHAAASTVDHVAIAVDGDTGLALQVEIFAKGQKAAALKLGFGDIDFGMPAASRFAFSPPRGSTVTNESQGSNHAASPDQKPTAGAGPTDGTKPAGSAGKAVTVGQDWTSVEIFTGAQLPPQLNQFLKAASPVNTAAGPGKLLSSSLLNVLVLDDGRVAVGAVDAATLAAAFAAAP